MNDKQKTPIGVGSEKSFMVKKLNKKLDRSLTELREATYMARHIWEHDKEALRFDWSDLVQIENALAEICKLSAGITPAADDSEESE